MPYPASFTPSFKSTERTSQRAIRGESQPQSPHTLSIHILDDDSLLTVFYLYRPAILGGDEDEINSILWATNWRWWYKLTHVCQRWRNLILGSASYLRICLVCTYGTPVADMLAHSPSLPIIIDYFYPTTTEEDEGIILALELRDRVRSICLRMPAPNLQNLIMTIDGEYPALEHLTMDPTRENGSTLVLPETLQAPRLRHLVLKDIALPMGPLVGPRLLTTAMDLVTLSLSVGTRSSYFQPNILLQWLSFIPRLEKLRIIFSHPVRNGDVKSQLMHTPIMTSVTLPNLGCFKFQGASAYMEAIIRWIITPRLEKPGMEIEQPFRSDYSSESFALYEHIGES